MRKTSHRIVFSSRWSRRKQIEELDEWQFMARLNYGQLGATVTFGLIEESWSTE